MTALSSYESGTQRHKLQQRDHNPTAADQANW